jgi:hypothetical protein
MPHPQNQQTGGVKQPDPNISNGEYLGQILEITEKLGAVITDSAKLGRSHGPVLISLFVITEAYISTAVRASRHQIPETVLAVRDSVKRALEEFRIGLPIPATATEALEILEILEKEQR